MTLLDGLLILVAGFAAGAINTVVGSGTLITFPILLALGYPPVTANVSNTIGLVPGSASGAIGYRRELAGQRSRVLRLGTASAAGGLLGGVLLLVLPGGAFDAIVPALVLLGVVLVLAGPRVSRWVSGRREGEAPERAWWVWPAVALTGVYGGYFGAAQGVLLMALLGIGVADTLQRLNAVKNILAATTNGVSGLLFIVLAHVDWRIVLLIAAGSVVGGQVGALVGRRLPPLALRIFIVVVGVVALVGFLVR